MKTFYNTLTGQAAVFADDALLSDWPEYTDTAPTVTADETAAEVRKQRDDLLKQSDWTQLSDAPVDQATWATYRSALRDITDQAGFPNGITWPIKPE